MRWQGQRESDNVEDRRRAGMPVRGTAIGAGGLLLLPAFAVLTGEEARSLFLEGRASRGHGGAKRRPPTAPAKGR